MTDQTAQNTTSASQDKFDFERFAQALKARGRTDQEIGQLLAGSMKLTALDLYVAVMTTLSDTDFAELDKLPTEKEIMQKAEELFTQKTGMTLDNLAEEIQSGSLRAAEEAGK